MMRPVKANEIVAMINRLRGEEGHSLAILCDNPEAESADSQTGVEVCADWTDWKERRFLARSWGLALRDAFEAMLHATGGQP